jgi:hypothetical protein
MSVDPAGSLYESLRLRHRIIRLRSPPAENPLYEGKDPLEARKAQDQASALEKAKTTTSRNAPGPASRPADRAGRTPSMPSCGRPPLRPGLIIVKLPVGGISTDLVLKVIEQPVGDQADAPTFWIARTETASRVRRRSKTCWTGPRRRSCVTATAVSPRGVTGRSCRRSRLQQTS